MLPTPEIDELPKSVIIKNRYSREYCFVLAHIAEIFSFDDTATTLYITLNTGKEKPTEIEFIDAKRRRYVQDRLYRLLDAITL
jgi:hypothetical protein